MVFKTHSTEHINHQDGMGAAAAAATMPATGGTAREGRFPTAKRREPRRNEMDKKIGIFGIIVVCAVFMLLAPLNASAQTVHKVTVTNDTAATWMVKISIEGGGYTDEQEIKAGDTGNFEVTDKCYYSLKGTGDDSVNGAMIHFCAANEARVPPGTEGSDYCGEVRENGDWSVYSMKSGRRTRYGFIKN